MGIAARETARAGRHAALAVARDADAARRCDGHRAAGVRPAGRRDAGQAGGEASVLLGTAIPRSDDLLFQNKNNQQVAWEEETAVSGFPLRSLGVNPYFIDRQKS